MNKMHIYVFNKESLKRFYVNKLERIVFPVLILGAIEFTLQRTSFSVRHLLYFVVYPVTGLGSYFVPFLLVFYFIAAPILLWLYRKTGAWVILISLLLFPISYPIFAHARLGLDSFMFYDYLFYIFYWGPAVALGCAIGGFIVLIGGNLSLRSLTRERWFALTLILGLALYEAVFILAYPVVSNTCWYYVFPTSIAGIVPFAILFSILQYFNSFNRRIFSFLAFFGKISLEIYLVQMIYFSIPSQIIVRDFVKALFGGSSNTVASVGVTFIISLTIVTSLALIAVCCLQKLFSFVKDQSRQRHNIN
jgi:peptidoglycan/LPS O-acetylase OafA/YrhL